MNIIEKINLDNVLCARYERRVERKVERYTNTPEEKEKV